MSKKEYGWERRLVLAPVILLAIIVQGLEKAIASPSSLNKACQMQTSGDEIRTIKLAATIEKKDSDKSRVNVNFSKEELIKQNPNRESERFRKKLEKVFNQKENLEFLKEVISGFQGTHLSDENEKELIQTLNRLLLNSGYITSDVITIDALLINDKTATIEFTVFWGQIVEIHPWLMKSGEIKVMLKHKNSGFTFEVNRVDRITASILKKDEIANKLEEKFKNRFNQLSPKQQQGSILTEILLKNTLIDLSEMFPSAEVKLKSKEERVATVQSSRAILITFELVWRQELPQSWQSYLCKRIRRGTQYPLNASDIEEQLRLLREDTAIDGIEGILRKTKRGRCISDPYSEKELQLIRVLRDITRRKYQESQRDGENQENFFTQIEHVEDVLFGAGKSCLEARVIKAKPFSGSVGFDNYSPPSVGSVRGSAELRYRNGLVVGDEIGFTYLNTVTGGNEIFDINYRVPLNAMNGALQFRALPSGHSRITQKEFEDLGIRGRSELYEFTYRQPLIRTPRREFALSLGLTSQNGQTFLFDQLPTPFGIGPDADGVSRTRVIKLGAEYLTRSSQSALLLRSQFNFGTEWLDATKNSGSVPDGQFFSWLGQIQWLQQIRKRHLLVVQADLQLTPDSLLPSQQFVIGGGQSVRGYQQNSRSGDNGFRFSIEDRIALWNRDIAANVRDRQGYLPDELNPNPKPDRGCDEPLQDLSWSLVPFFDAGVVWNHPDNPNVTEFNRFFASAGVGLLLEARPLTKRLCSRQLSFRIDYGYPLVRSDTRSDNLQDHGIYFSFRYRF